VSGPAEGLAPVAFVLSGGPGCGAVVELPLVGGDMYLIEFAVPNSPGVKHVWAYEFVNRSVKKGWLLEVRRWVAFRGMTGGSC